MPKTKTRKQSKTAKASGAATPKPELSKKEQRKIAREKAKDRQKVISFVVPVLIACAAIAAIGSVVAESLEKKPKIGRKLSLLSCRY